LTKRKINDIIIGYGNIYYKNIIYDEVWLSLVERYVRDSITVLGVEFSRRAENP